MLPIGVRLHQLQTHVDQRGTMAEVFRDEWIDGVKPVQWNFFRSAAGALRGVHVHVVHDDVALVLEGRATLGLRDAREASPTFGMTVAQELSGSDRTSVVIPHGVLHGFLFREETLLLVGVTNYYDPADDLGCLWSDPGLAIPWPEMPIVVSDRDRVAPPFSALLERIRPWQPFAIDELGSEAASERAGRSSEPVASR